MMKMIRVIKIAFLIGFVTLFLISCPQFQPAKPLQVFVKGESFSLLWDDDANLIPNNPGKAVSYNIFYRVHGDLDWQLLSKIDADSRPGINISNEDLSYGVYDFGVSSVGVSGEESDIHSSLDNTADPFCGWYINWIGSN